MTALNEQVLVLNKNFTAIGIATVKRALCMLLGGVAEAVDVERAADGRDHRYSTYDFDSWVELSEFRDEFERDQYSFIQCVRMRLAAPLIVRLTGYGEYRKIKPRLSRRNIFARDDNTCQYCGKKTKLSELSIDHVVPKSRGGKLEWTNVACACTKCNVKKANRTPKEAAMKLIKVPRAPMHAFGVAKVGHWSWKHFVDEAYWCVELRD